MNKVITNKKGFTLVELLIVIGLLSITAGLTADILISVIRSYTKTQVLNEIEQQANFITLKLDNDLKDAVIVSVDPSYSGRMLQITKRDTVTYTYYVNDSNDAIYYSDTWTQSDGIAALTTVVNLLSSGGIGGVKVDCMSGFNCFKYYNLSPGIVSYKLNFVQGQTGALNNFTGSVDFENYVVLKNDY